MKKNTLLSSILVILFCAVSYGQEINYGFKAGINVNQINSFSFDFENRVGAPPLEDYPFIEDTRFGLSATFFAEIHFNETFSLQPELTYSAQGNKFRGLRYDFIQLPIGLKFDLNKFYVIGGPQVGLKISDFEQSDNFKSIDFLAFGGIGYFFTDNIFLEARYTLGFAEIFEDDAAVELPFPDIAGSDETLIIVTNTDNVLSNLTGNNSFFTLSIGYRL